MIKNPTQFLKEQQQEREKYLKSMKITQSVHLLESLLTSGLLEEFKFSDDQPMGLARSIKNARKRI